MNKLHNQYLQKLKRIYNPQEKTLQKMKRIHNPQKRTDKSTTSECNNTHCAKGISYENKEIMTSSYRNAQCRNPPPCRGLDDPTQHEEVPLEVSVSVEKEVSQLLIMDKIKPENPKDLTKEDRRAPIGYVMSLKEKRDVKIKGRDSKTK